MDKEKLDLSEALNDKFQLHTSWMSCELNLDDSGFHLRIDKPSLKKHTTKFNPDKKK